MKLSDLKHNPKNPRKITDPKLAMLRKSLQEFGDLSGIVYNRRTDRLSGGHQRTKVLPPDADIVITQTYSQPTRTGTVAQGHVLIAGEKMAYREVDWDEQKEIAANIAANKHGGEWDYPTYVDALLELDHANYDLDLTGVTDLELEKLVAYVKPEQQLLELEHAEEHASEASTTTHGGITKIIIHLTDEEYEAIFPKIQQICKALEVHDLSQLFQLLICEKAEHLDVHSEES